ncbi:MAG TPA: DEAD/DEAH box helicase, partial [Candidatus Eisenbacteria bacterium]|nr:DEAD/DEAH box helicase [Candidatus Eisenbacteria bacterium]
DVWRGRGGLVVFEQLMDHPEEHLLAELGRASRLFPDLEAALALVRPMALDLDPGGAYRFLSETAPLLAEAGFGVHVPPWWGSRSARLGLRLRTRRSGEKEWVSGPSRFGLDHLCEYEWELAIGDQPLSEEELRELASFKQPLVRVRGRWVELRPQEAEAALALMRRQTGAGAGHMTAGEVLRIGLGLAPTVDGLPVVEVRADGWMADFLGGPADRRLEAVPAPGGFSGSLRPYQERGLAWLRFLGGLGLGACLADDMGLGKTVQLLAVLLAERPGTRAPDGPGEANGACQRPTLLVCPMSVVGNWQREASRFAPGLRVHVHHGMGRLGGAELAAAAAASDLVITTYALAARDQESLAAIEWGRVVLDEAQNVKTSTAKQTKAVRALRAPERVALTGTPVENRLTELWSIMEFLNPGLLGPYTEFRAHVATPIERYRDEEATRLLKRVTQPFILRRLKTDRTIIADLPDKVEMKVFCNITREQATLYQAVLDEMMERIAASEGIERSGHVLAGLMKLKQVLNHPAQMLRDGSRLDGRSGKLARTEEILEEVLAAGEKALVFTQFSEMGELLQGHLAARSGHEVLFLHGGTARRLRDEMVERFQSSAGPPVFVLSLKAGGTGLNLTAANHVIHFDRWWNPAVEDQATDRAFRIGQRRDVQVRKLVCVGTLEERIDGMIEDKRELAGRIVGSGES